MTDQRLLGRHDPRRYDALGLVRRLVKAGRFTEGDVKRWKAEIGDDDVTAIVREFAPKKAPKKAASTAAPDKE